MAGLLPVWHKFGAQADAGLAAVARIAVRREGAGRSTGAARSTLPCAGRFPMGGNTMTTLRTDTAAGRYAARVEAALAQRTRLRGEQPLGDLFGDIPPS